jgi:hypothetical protein
MRSPRSFNNPTPCRAALYLNSKQLRGVFSEWRTECQIGSVSTARSSRSADGSRL